MNPVVHEILQRLDMKIESIPSTSALPVVKESIDELSGYMKLFSFRSRAEEVLYFKVFKPRFMAHRLCAEYSTRGNAEPLWEERTVEQQSFYSYYTSGQSHRDSFYFTCRQCKTLDFEMPELLSNNWQAYDKWVARILAQEWVMKKIIQ